MSQTFAWTPECYERSFSSRCWWFTPYDGGKWSDSIRTDNELQAIVEMEYRLAPIPLWAQQIVERSINQACPCGHYLFPLPYLEVLDAIGTRQPPTLVHSCFTAERQRKRQAMDYVLCLDAWLAGAPPDTPARELDTLGSRKADWAAICADLWQVLGERTELKEHLVERILHTIRWAIKFTFWDNDQASEFGRDQYLGDYARTQGAASIDGYYERSPFYYEQASPHIQGLETHLAEICPDWDRFRAHMMEWWLCAPKSFRFLERILWAIGQERPPRSSDRVPGFLQCEDTFPNQDNAARWWTSFCAALGAWWQQSGAEQTLDANIVAQVWQRLETPTPLKQWLARLFLHKLERLEANGEQLAHLVNAGHTHKRGTKPLQISDYSRH
ncbi:MAG: hypothetical protein JXA89_03330 [Anaerolineae bacterium]|nr:hypothetical protein [Anaerolineae bacterium]